MIVSLEWRARCVSTIVCLQCCELASCPELRVVDDTSVPGGSDVVRDADVAVLGVISTSVLIAINDRTGGNLNLG